MHGMGGDVLSYDHVIDHYRPRDHMNDSTTHNGIKYELM